MKKIMIYCQYLAGMGHLVRSSEIIRSLVKDFKVCFVNGGQPVPQFELPAEVEVIYLPGLWQDDRELKPIDESQSLEAVKAQRRHRLLEAFDQFEPDCLITECYPFSKVKLAFELIPLLERTQLTARPTRVVCSLRDLIMTQPMSRDAWVKRSEKVCRLINQYYDAVLFHADATFQKLEDCFPRVEDLKCDIIYTGYVAQSPPEQQSLTAEDIAGLSDKTPAIVASVGGGRHGYSLLSALVEASPLLAHVLPHQIYAFAGPFMPEDDFAQLQRAAAARPNVTLRRFTSRLIDYLQKAELSVSLGGYNTTMNLLRTRVRSLVLPSLSKNQNTEQRIRAEKLANLGVLSLLEPDDLGPERLVHTIQTCLNKAPVMHQINLQGADNTAQHLQSILTEPALKAVGG
ncbi:MAG: hypothetical protein F6J95_019330 [Leptolyngbya sp. SIO1E4]|nr:hypothetical protein [Leptolyngbya sp. SIO1E4]